MRSGKKFQKLKAANKLDQSLSHYEPFLMPSVNFECVAVLLLCTVCVRLTTECSNCHAIIRPFAEECCFVP